MLDPHQLCLFLVAAETLNFSRAAERLRASQPSVSMSSNSKRISEHLCSSAPGGDWL